MTVPFVVRTVQPVLAELDRESEEAAASLGASRFTIFRRIILPSLFPAIAAGAALSFARAISEYGSLVLLSGNLPLRTEVTSVRILTLHRERQPGRRRRPWPRILLLVAAGRDRGARRHPAPGGPPWLTTLTAGAVAGDRERRRRGDRSRTCSASSWSATSCLLVAWPVALVGRSTRSRDGFDSLRTALDDPVVTHALRLTVVVAVIAVGHQPRVRRGHLAAAGALPVPGPAPAERAHRPAAVGVAGRGRPGARARLRRPERVVRARRSRTPASR